jgi:hypothetical protein
MSLYQVDWSTRAISTRPSPSGALVLIAEPELPYFPSVFAALRMGDHRAISAFTKPLNLAGVRASPKAITWSTHSRRIDPISGTHSRPRSEQPDQQRPNYSAAGPHRARASLDSSSLANG